MQYTSPDNGQTSDMMWDAGRGGSGPWVHCSCGIDHSITDQEFQESGYQGFGYIELDGKLFVYECEGCAKKLAKYENFIWENRDHIRRYLKIRVDQEKSWAEQEHLLNVLSQI
jgi:hypothetical protein